MKATTLVLLGRLAWIEAYLAHYGAEPAEVLGALGVEPWLLDEVRSELRVKIELHRSRGDLELSNRFVSELMRARRVLAERKLSLDEVTVTLRVRRQDEHALPDVVLPEKPE